jgi:hypothetical protein
VAAALFVFASTGTACLVATDASPVANLDIRVVANPDTIASGARTTLTVTVTNASRDQVRFTADPCGPLDMDIRTASGATILPGVIGCQAGNDLVLLPPGAAISATYEWAATGSGASASVAPGVYGVRGIVRTANGRRYGAPTPVWVTTP